MAAKFSLKIKHTGSSQVESFVGSDGKVFAQKLAGAIENSVYNAAGQMIAEKTEESKRRNLFLAAMFFQRVVSRTPLDEDYMTGINERGKPTMHYADNDSVRDCWVASYRNKKITSKYLRESCGCTFLKFNDRTEVKKIYEQFLELAGKTKNISGVHIDNTHERFPMLEYGEYLHDGSIKSGEHYEHGVKGGYSVQAPAGMLRLTQQEFEDTAFNIPTEELMQNGRKWQKRLKKSGSAETVKRILRGKSKLSQNDAERIAEVYK